jgi:hypothetical protein
MSVVSTGVPSNAPIAQAPVVSKSLSKGNQVRMAQRHARPGATLLGNMVLKSYVEAKVLRKAGSKSAARCAGLYTPKRVGLTVVELLATHPDCRKDLVWDYQHGFAEFE